MSLRRATTAATAVSLITLMAVGGAPAHAEWGSDGPTDTSVSGSASPTSASAAPSASSSATPEASPRRTRRSVSTLVRTAPSSAPAAPQTSQAPAFRSTIVYATTAAVARATTSTSAAVVGTLLRGHHVGTAGPERDGWTPVNFQGHDAWVLSSQLSTTKPASTFTPTIVWSHHTAAVRSQHDKTSAWLGDLRQGSHVGTRGIARAGWTPISYQGRPGWVPSWTISTSRPAPRHAAARPASTHLVYATTTVNVRSSASTASSKVGTLYRGYHLGTRGAAVGGWTPVTYQGRSAWVASRYLSTSPVPRGVASVPRAVTNGKIDARCRTKGTVVCINKSEYKLRLLRNGKVLITLDARFGSELNPTREGVFSIFLKNKNHVSTLYGSKMPYAMFFSGGEAIHYSSDFAARGYAGHSHGCVNLRSMSGIKYVWDRSPVGTKVVVYH